MFFQNTVNAVPFEIYLKENDIYIKCLLLVCTNM